MVPVLPSSTIAYETTLYPESDGQPMAENTVQYRWIVRLVSNLKQLLKEQTAFVAGDLLWYPLQVEQSPAPCQAPDAMVVLGRPDGDRRSYKQWEENGIAPQVVFEILSPSNTAREMLSKQSFYGEHGVLEMFFYDPDSLDFWGLVRQDQDHAFSPIGRIHLPWSSPTLGIRFDWCENGLALFHPHGELFKDPEDLFAERNRLRAKLEALGINPDD